jgi:pimeloyl-ACP methyl ester carboxylesterase
MKKTQMVSAGIAFVLAITSVLHAQTTTVFVRSSSVADLNMMLEAVEATEPLPAELAPVVGNFYSAAHPEWPPMPANVHNVPVWPLGNDWYLADDRDISDTAADMGTRTLSVAAANIGSLNSLETSGPLYGSNDLWLEIIGVSNGAAWFNLNNATNQVYAIWSTTNLLAGWDVATEIWPTNAEVMPFTVPMLERPNLFVRAQDWTDVPGDGGIPLWWYWLYFGRTDLSATNLDAVGGTLLFDYQNNIDPTFLVFSIILTNQYVNTSSPVLSLISGGDPVYDMAILVNDTNQTDAIWQPFTSNVVVHLNTGDGGYDVQIGLRQSPGDPNQLWQTTYLILDTVPPLLAVTNFISGVVSRPTIQAQGYASEPLSGLTFDISNASGLVTNQTGYLTGVFFDDNLGVYTTNYFQCPDIRLARGTNLISLHATDLAGNTTRVDLMVENVSNTNSPGLNVVWPPDGAQISSSSFTVQAQTDDNASTVMAVITDSNGNTNTGSGLVEQDGTIWVSDLPLGSGANQLTLTVTNVLGSKTTNLTLYQSSVLITVTPLTSDQLNQTSVTVTGTISEPGDTVIVNGVTASVDEEGNWAAEGVPVSAYGTAMIDVEVYAGNAANFAQGNLRFTSFDGTSAEDSIGSHVYRQPQPAAVKMASYFSHKTSARTAIKGQPNMMIYTGTTPVFMSGSVWVVLNSDDDTVNWAAGVGGTQHDYGYSHDLPGYFDVWQEFGPSQGDVGNAWSSWAGWESANEAGTYDVMYNDPTAFSHETGSWSKVVRTRVVIEPAGQEPAGQTNVYLVRACARENTNPQDSDAFILPLPPEWLQINGQTLINSGITNDDGSVWGAITVVAPAGVTTNVTPIATQVYTYWDYTFNVQELDVTRVMAVDNNRDGQISQDGSDDITASKPFHFWINDSKEHGDDESSGGADDQIPGSSTPNYSWNHPQGRSDYVNFFPVVLCLSNVLQWLAPTNGFEYRLSQADNAVKFAYTSLTQSNAFDYVTNSTDAGNYGSIAGYDPSFSQDSSGAITYTGLSSADLVKVFATGTKLNTNWLEQVQAGDGTGIILVEGCAATTQPLMLEIWKNGQKLGGVPLYLSISGVEQMFRHANFSYVNGTVTVPARSDAPNEPQTNGKNLVFLHGYNVNQQQARGVESEMFKRFYWSGSKAKFYGVTWNGSVSQGDFISGISCNLQTNVVNALQTAPHLADFLGTLPADKTVVVAHSLGNMVVLSAISDYSATMSKYFMIDCAVPMEAVQGNTPFEPAMIPSAWQQYSNRTFASTWWQLFANTDARNTLTWSNRLGNLGSVDIYNFYSSPGEEVLREDTDDPPSGILSGGVTQLINIWAGVAKGAYVWVWQEKGKGNAHFDDFISSTHGGWRFPVNEYGDPIPVPPSTANSLPASTLQQTPVFNFGSYYDQLYGPFPDLALTNTDASASAYAQAHRDRILSDAIPALTLPVGANFVETFGADNNFNMQTSFETGWPTARFTGGERNNNWYHSDFDYVAYPFTYKLFDEIATDGYLK